MTVAALTPSKEYIENGVTVAFAVPFRFRASTHIKAQRIAASGAVSELVYGTDYSVTGGETDSGGTLTVTAAAVAGTRLRIRRETPRSQEMDYTTGDTFPAESHEVALDKAILIDQEQDQKINDTAVRALLVPLGETIDPLQAQALRDGKIPQFSGSGLVYLTPEEIGGVGPVGPAGGLAALKSYGAIDTPANALATANAALAAQGRGGTLLINGPANIGAGALVDPGVDLIGHYPLMRDDGDGQGTRVLNRAGERMDAGFVGEGQLFVWLNKIYNFALCTTALVGDSNMAGYAGAVLASLYNAIPGNTATNYGVGSSTLRDWIDNTGTVNGTGYHMAAVIAAAPTKIVLGYGATNEGYYGRSLDQYDADLDYALTTIRNALPRRVCSIQLLSANSQSDGANGRPESFVHQARASQYRLARKHGCAWFDKMALTPDASVDYGAGANQNTWFDPPRVHTQPAHSQLIASRIMDRIIPHGFAARAILGETPSIDSAVKTAVFADGLSKYPRGGTIIQRAQVADGWPFEGFVKTTVAREGVGGAVQELFSFSDGRRLKRHWAGSVWTLFVADGVISLGGNAVLATALTSYPGGYSSQRCLPADGWPLDGFVRTYREPVTGNFGYQEVQRFDSDVPPQRRQFLNSGWTGFTALF